MNKNPTQTRVTTIQYMGCDHLPPMKLHMPLLEKAIRDGKESKNLNILTK
jgi:hypothetical protein